MDKALQREKTRERVKRYRNKTKALQSNDIVTPDVTLNVTLPPGLTPALLDALTDKSKRHGLELIHQSLKNFNQTEGVRYGVNGPTFTDVGEMLEVTG